MDPNQTDRWTYRPSLRTMGHPHCPPDSTAPVWPSLVVGGSSSGLSRSRFSEGCLGAVGAGEGVGGRRPGPELGSPDGFMCLEQGVSTTT